MPTQTLQTNTGDVTMPSGDEIYDALMADIEPDLITTNLPHLDEKYAGETPEQKAARMARYEAAYARYDAVFTEWLANLKGVVNDTRHQALVTAEEKDRGDEQATLDKIMQSFTA